METSLRTVLALSIFVVVSIAHAGVSHHLSNRLVTDLELHQPGLAGAGVGLPTPERVRAVRDRTVERLSEELAPISRALRAEVPVAVQAPADAARLRAVVAASGVDVP